MRRRDVVGQSRRISKGKGGKGGNEKFVRAGRSRGIKYFWTGDIDGGLSNRWPWWQVV